MLKKVTLLNTPELLLKALQAEHHNHPDIEYFQTKKVRIELVEGENVAKISANLVAAFNIVIIIMAVSKILLEKILNTP